MPRYIDQYTKQSMWEAHGKRCFYCREGLIFKNIQVDHVIPQVVFEGQESDLRNKYNLDVDFNFNGLDNFVPACQSCNAARKGSKELQNAIPLWLRETKTVKEKIEKSAARFKNKLRFDLPDKYREFFLTSPDFLLSDLSIERIRKTDIPLYKNLAFHPDCYPLRLTSPDDPKVNVYIKSLSQYEKYRDLGYYGSTTPDISLESLCNICLTLFEKFEDALPVSSIYDFKNSYRSLQATTLHVIGPEEDFDYKDYETIGDYIDSKDNITEEISDNRVKLVIDHPEFKKQEYYIFKEVLQADFTGEGNNESIIFVHYKSAGTFSFSFLIHATYWEERLIVL